MTQTERLAQLRQHLIEYFDDEELRTLCFDLSVDYDNLPGRAKANKARELLSNLDQRGRISDLIKLCSTQRPNIPWQEILTEIQAEPPFKGLQYFDEADADLFFGREILTAELIRRLSKSRFLAVVGASGSGKSSLVRAGLVPALKRGETMADCTLPPEGSMRWPIHVITPGAHPLKELATSLMRDSESVTAATTLINDLSRDVCSLDLAVSRLLKRPGSGNQLMLVVDQFEELFTSCKEEAECTTFVDNLLRATATETNGQTMVVIALRADFYAHCARFANLREALEKHQAYIGPMSADELRRAIKEPARRKGWEFEPGLVDLLLHDVGADRPDQAEPGALPLLSHALLETWKHRHGRALTLEGYYNSGGVRGAIAQSADAVFNQLTPQQQAIARHIFLQLTELGQGAGDLFPTPDTRRRVALSELAPRPEDKPAVEAVVKRLADARLITTGEGVAEVAHEALIREWPALRQWLDQDRAGLRLHRQLAQHTQEWLKLKRDPSALYRGARLAQALEWIASHDRLLNPLERRFLAASKGAAEREAAEREAQRQRELRAAQNLAQAAQARAQAEHQVALRTRVLLALIITSLPALLLGVQFAYRQYLRWQALGPALVEIPASTVTLGADVPKADLEEYLPPNRYTLSAYAIEPYEVTNRRYILCVQAGACAPPNAPSSKYAPDALADLPVVNVNAWQAARFCAWLGRRLPDELEWERAAHSANEDPWPWGHGPPSPERANLYYSEQGDNNLLQPVGQATHGLSKDKVYDLVGNAWEWTRSAYDLETTAWAGVQTDPPASLSVRGGGANISYNSIQNIAYRLETAPSLSNEYTGLRCAMDR